MKYVFMKKCCPNTHTHIYIHIYVYILDVYRAVGMNWFNWYTNGHFLYPFLLLSLP